MYIFESDKKEHFPIGNRYRVEYRSQEFNKSGCGVVIGHSHPHYNIVDFRFDGNTYQTPIETWRLLKINN